MKRRAMTWIAALLMLAMATTASAATPSIKTTDVPIKNATTSTGVPLPDDFMAAVTSPEQISPEARATFAALSEAIAGGVPLSQALALPVEVLAAIDEGLAASGLTLDGLTLSEFTAFQMGAFEADEFGDVTASFEFLTPFAVGEPLVVLVGVPADGAVTWLPCPAVAAEDGSVQITFPLDVLRQMAGHQVMLAVFSAAQAEA